MKAITRVAGLGVASMLALPANAQLLAHKDLSLATALTIATTAMDTCKGQGYRVSVTVVGRNGEPLVQLRGEDASQHTYDFSLRKAYTARTFRVASGEIVNRFKQDPTYFAVHVPNTAPSQGALPIKIGDEVIGAAGVSGAPGGEKDEACAKAGLDKVADQLKRRPYGRHPDAGLDPRFRVPSGRLVGPGLRRDDNFYKISSRGFRFIYRLCLAEPSAALDHSHSATGGTDARIADPQPCDDYARARPSPLERGNGWSGVPRRRGHRRNRQLCAAQPQASRCVGHRHRQRASSMAITISA